MRFTRNLLGLAAIGLGATAPAQVAPPANPPAEPTPPGGSQAQTGLSGLEDTVNELQDEPPPAAPAPTQEAPPPAPPPPAPPPAPRPSAPLGPLTRADRAQLDAAAQRGRLLAVIDRAGRIATQDMLSRVSDPAGAGIAGWLAEQEGNAVSVTFYAEGADAAAPPAAVYRVTILGGRVTSREVFLAGSRPPLSDQLARMAAARRATGALDHHPCGGEDFNVLVVPPAAPDAPIDVYQISPQTARGHYPLGGHFKSTIAPDGSVAASRGFTNACLDLAATAPAAGAQPAPLAVTHLLDPLPTEIHVLLSIWTGHPLVVVAGDPQRLFAVTPEGIGELPR